MNKYIVPMGGRKIHPPYFDRKLTHTGTTRTMAIGGIIPDNWESVRIVVKRSLPHCVTINLYRITKVVEHAPTPTTNKNSEQNT